MYGTNVNNSNASDLHLLIFAINAVCEREIERKKGRERQRETEAERERERESERHAGALSTELALGSHL